MQLRKCTAAAVAALSTAAVATGLVIGAGPASASSPANVPVVRVHINSKSITLNTGRTLHAGRILFRVVTHDGEHGLQIARLHKGYSLQQAGADINSAFGGNVAAVRRVDHNISFRGGAQTEPKHPGTVGVTLSKGQYVFLDTEGNAFALVNVVGKAHPRKAIAYTGTVTAFTYGFAATPSTLPAAGYVRIVNQADQPHFVDFNHVKASTTPAMVRKYFKSGGQGQPSWGLPENASAGVVSPGRSEILRYNLPPGKYLLACFWPDSETGMPHAVMGMWKLVTLK
jgi:hypothetical protein